MKMKNVYFHTQVFNIILTEHDLNRHHGLYIQ